MTHAEIEQEILFMLGMSFPMNETPKPESTLDELGFDSLGHVQVQMLFEDRWGQERMTGYEPEGSTRVTDMAAEVERRLA